jgi:hypothetical protein
MRALTFPTQASAGNDASRPYCLLQINFPPPIGARWFAQEDFGAGDGSSWDNAQGRVLEWGVVRVELKADKAVNVVGDCTITLRDEDKILWNYFQRVEPQRSWVTIYQQFRGLGQADLVKVHQGIVNAPCSWSEKEHAVTLDVTDISTYFDHTVGNIADRLSYPNVVQTDENKMIPLVFGHVKRATAVALDFGPVTTLARQIAVNDMALFVVDAEKFPQDTPTQLWISAERINGSFHGNAFTVTERGGPVRSGTVTALGTDPQHIVDSALTGVDGQWAGYYIEITTPDGNVQRRIIRSYDSVNHVLVYGQTSCYLAGGQWMGDLFLESNGPPSYTNSVYTLPVAATYQIVTNLSTHATGERVYLARSSYTYVANDAPSKAVYYVEGWGHPIIGSPEEYYCCIAPCAYTINRNDTATCPGRAVTSVSFRVPPSQYDTRLRDDNLWITLDGVETNGDGSGALFENPADVIQAVHTRFMGVPPACIDQAAFAAAREATAPLKMGFALQAQKSGMELCSDLAFQARCSEVWFAGQAKLIYLTNVMTPAGTPPATGRDRYLGSLDIGRREWNQVVTEVIGAYVDNAVKETIILRSAAAEAFVGGRKSKTIDFWAYASLPPVQGVAQFWLNRWRFIWQQIALVDSLRRLDAEPYDLFDLDLAGWFGAGQIARVFSVEHTLGGGAKDAAPGIKLSAEVPYFPDSICDTLAEAMPPAGCWACETTCQLGCELFCTTAAQLESPQSSSTGHETTGHETTEHETTEHETTERETTEHETTEHETTERETTERETTESETESETTPPSTHPTGEPTAGLTTLTEGPTVAHTSGPTTPPACENCESGTTPRSVVVTYTSTTGAFDPYVFTLNQDVADPCHFQGSLPAGPGNLIVDYYLGEADVAIGAYAVELSEAIVSIYPDWSPGSCSSAINDFGVDHFNGGLAWNADGYANDHFAVSPG